MKEVCICIVSVCLGTFVSDLFRAAVRFLGSLGGLGARPVTVDPQVTNLDRVVVEVRLPSEFIDATAVLRTASLVSLTCGLLSIVAAIISCVGLCLRVCGRIFGGGPPGHQAVLLPF